MNYNNFRKIFDTESTFNEQANSIIKLVSDYYGLSGMNQFTQNFYSDNKNSYNVPLKKEFSRYTDEIKTATLIPVLHLPSSNGADSSKNSQKFAVLNNPPQSVTLSNKKNLEAEVDMLTNILMSNISYMEKKNSSSQNEDNNVKTKLCCERKLINSPIFSEPRLKTSLNHSPSTSYNKCFRCLKPFQNTSSSSINGPLRSNFHPKCFNCYSCNSNLNLDSFFYAQKRLLCSKCLHKSLEKCIACHFIINDRVIRVLGQPYHPKCFTCTICNCCLDGKPFTVDVQERMFCLDDFHKQYAPKCDGCGQLICPQNGDNENKRIISADKTFHLQCFGVHSKP